MWKVVLQQEQEDPPEPPSGLAAVSAGEFQRLLSRPLSEVILDTTWTGPVRKACSLCGQRLIDMQRIKTHWQMSHKVAWRFIKGEILGDMAALSSTIRRPCQYCGSGASDVIAHSRQCPVLFQLLATRSLHQKGRLMEARSQGTSVIKRQDKNQPAYAAYSVESSPIGQALGLSRCSKASATIRSGAAAWILLTPMAQVDSSRLSQELRPRGVSGPSNWSSSTQATTAMRTQAFWLCVMRARWPGLLLLCCGLYWSTYVRRLSSVFVLRCKLSRK